MSDHDSTHSAEHARHHANVIERTNSHNSHASMETEALFDDHRLQADSLPIRHNSVLGRLPPPAISSSVLNDSDECAIQEYSTSPSNHPSTRGTAIRSTAIGISPTEKIAPSSQQHNKRGRSRSFTEQLKNFVKKDERDDQPSNGFLLNTQRKSSKGNADNSPVIHPLNKTISRSSHNQRNIDLDTEMIDFERRRRLTRASLNDSDADSHRSRDSQETEEDVCFPMVPEHVKINGIDFDEIEEFVEESRVEAAALKKERDLNNNSSSDISTAAARYIPKPYHYDSDKDDNPGVSFGSNKVEGEDIPPDRFSFFSSEVEETIHGPDIQSLLKPNETIRELFKNGESTWWLDCICPTDTEMKVLAKAFGIHPLTAEDIRMQETREKVELFRSYYFVCFHTFEADKESEDFLEPINVYIVVFRHGVLTFHFGPISHAANVRRRVRQLRDYVDVSADWLCYALIDDITDSFAPVIHAIEYEADAIEDQVFLMREMDFSHMLQKIGESRRKVMTLMRLLSGKADVIKMFAKRCQDEVQGIGPALTSNVNLANLSTSYNSQPLTGNPSLHQNQHNPNQQHFQNQQHQKQAQPRADIALYLGDIQDHVVTMYQNLLSYEKIFSRSHSNYLAQLQVESFNSNNKVTEMLSKVTLIGTILVPLNLITGLFGMNVRVPGEQNSTLGPFFGILGVVILLVVIFSVAANWWLTRKAREQEEESARRSILDFRRNKARGIASDRVRETRSVISVPSRLNRYD
ncbi:hypothetical protein WICMUC_000639 [Wickerhamomyces mucosus]|uniref:Uncharacterized protein n=1 Tax=Wickerhamomyces mucosus TaxID=1378264 RepID=A0A9P8TIS0_9ASCO|nr:hypothetical protein WICMUC_000639 [Wickerhamomyces mucosus]